MQVSPDILLLSLCQPNYQGLCSLSIAQCYEQAFALWAHAAKWKQQDGFTASCKPCSSCGARRKTMCLIMGGRRKTHSRS